MFRRLLIANRGEVAARIARTAKRMGIEVVAVASKADLSQKWLEEVDEVIALGGSKSAESYLDQDAILEVARHANISAIHPGWGFLAENDVFAAKVEALGITFIGPRPLQIRQMGDKSLARKTMKRLGLDPIPGSKEPVGSYDDAVRVAEQVGYPILLKAVSGGGGRGMRGVDRPEDLKEAFAQASAEAISAFGDGRVYMERRIERGRHIEFQVIADHFGNVLCLGERECSLQRRHQKVLEEAPSAGLSDEERSRIIPRILNVVAASGYVNAGTVEMLLDQEGTAWFMEMNTRLQVEHSVTEEVTGLDLVELQIRVAANEALTLSQSDITVSGHSLECRINAEDPDDGFRPSPGRVTTLAFPEGEGIRVDTHLRQGDKISPYYDSMIAKLITYGADRQEAIERMRQALEGTVVEGVKTNIGLHKRILTWAPFVSGVYDTTSLESGLMES